MKALPSLSSPMPCLSRFRNNEDRLSKITAARSFLSVWAVKRMLVLTGEHHTFQRCVGRGILSHQEVDKPIRAGLSRARSS